MSTTGRLILLGLAVVVAVVALVIVQPWAGDDEDGESAPTTTPATTAPADGSTAPRTTTTEAEPAEPPVPRIRIERGKPVDGVEELEFKSGERVEFVVSSDVDDEVHVHGYDITEEVPAGGSARFSFEADAEGQFEVESHDFGTQIANLVIEP